MIPSMNCAKSCVASFESTVDMQRIRIIAPKRFTSTSFRSQRLAAKKLSNAFMGS